MTTSTPTVFELLDEIIAPITRAVPCRISAMRFFDPHADPELPLGLALCEDVAEEAAQLNRWHAQLAARGLSVDGVLAPGVPEMLHSIRHGDIRGVVTGVFHDRASPLQVQLCGDGRTGTVIDYNPGNPTVRTGDVRFLGQWTADLLPDHPEGPGDFIEIVCDRRGVIPASRERDLAIIRDRVARPRARTVLFDLIVDGTIWSQHPMRAFAIFDNDRGRFLVVTSLDRDNRWVLAFLPATKLHVSAWIADCANDTEESTCW